MSTGVRYVALLRGVNVGRAKRIGMAELRAAVEGAGFTGVRTLLNSGNVLFTATRASTPAQAAGRVEEAITGAFGITSRVLVLSGADVDAIVAENPLRDGATTRNWGTIGKLRALLSDAPD